MAKTQTETFIRRSVVDALRRAGWFVIYNMQMGFGQHSPDQVQFQKDCEAHGVTYILARGVNDVTDLLNFKPLF